jgi:hypothetical protein
MHPVVVGANGKCHLASCPGAMSARCRTPSLKDDRTQSAWDAGTRWRAKGDLNEWKSQIRAAA